MIKFREVVESILYNNLLFESEQKINWILSQPKLIQALEKRIQNDLKVPTNITTEQLLKDFDNASIVIGKFLPWVVKMYSQGEFEYTDLRLINNYLENFIKNLSKLEKRDINQYKSLNELNVALKNVKDIKGSRETRRDAKTGAEKIYEDNKWIILIPHTKEAAIQYGKHTKWCTAGINDNMFDDYNEDGPLYILINKVNPSEKYQFHFETDSYMDAEDEEIDLGTFLKENPEIKKFFRSIRNIDTTNNKNWPWLLSYDEYLKAVKSVPYQVLECMPEKYKDYNMYLKGVKNHYFVLEDVPEKFKDYKMCLEAVKTYEYALFDIPEKFKDYSMYLEAIKHKGLELQWVPEKFKDYKMCLEAVKDYEWALDYVPEEYRKKIKQELKIE